MLVFTSYLTKYITFGQSVTFRFI